MNIYGFISILIVCITAIIITALVLIYYKSTQKQKENTINITVQHKDTAVPQEIHTVEYVPDPNIAKAVNLMTKDEAAAAMAKEEAPIESTELKNMDGVIHEVNKLFGVTDDEEVNLNGTNSRY